MIRDEQHTSMCECIRVMRVKVQQQTNHAFGVVVRILMCQRELYLCNCDDDRSVEQGEGSYYLQLKM